MRRSRIKAMVTVPLRRKVANDSTSSETNNAVECDNKHQSNTDNTTAPCQQTTENNSQENQAQETINVIEDTTNEQLLPSAENVQSRDESMENFDKLQKGASQLSETISTTQSTETINITQSSGTVNTTELIEIGNITQAAQIVNTTQSSESINTTQIASPTKLTQSRLGFVRPTPKLDSGGRIRKNSIQGSGASASESEDDSRRVAPATSNHIRNDSMCSVQTIKDTVMTNAKINFEKKNKIGQKRRMLISESARRLAEARREFQIKHENKVPDRSKLTMYDLIYYNPVSNPMKKSQGSGVLTRKISECQSEEPNEEEEENEDDPSSAMPVPQVKVGPDGQLIIDEQSLVIEQTNIKKSKEMLAKEVIIDDDNNGSGFYKKRQKSKEWSKWETLKFYKALNTVGTDFLLMQTLFPNRTRQEIKMKFKKEEKVNRNLIEKALAYHQEFDTDILEKSLAVFENSEKEEKRELITQRKRKQEAKEKKGTLAERKRKCRIVASSIAETEESDEDRSLSNSVEQPNNIEENSEDQHSLKKANKRKQKKMNEEKKKPETAPNEKDDIESVNSCNDIDSDTEIYHVRPTKSGRLPKVRKLQGPDVNSLDDGTLDYSDIEQENIIPPKDIPGDTDGSIFDSTNLSIETNYTDSIEKVIPNITDVEPGSLVILSKEVPEEPGKSVLQVYMVSSNVSSQDNEQSNITPVDLPPELLATVTSRLSNVESIGVKDERE